MGVGQRCGVEGAEGGFDFGGGDFMELKGTKHGFEPSGFVAEGGKRALADRFEFVVGFELHPLFQQVWDRRGFRGWRVAEQGDDSLDNLIHGKPIRCCGTACRCVVVFG